MAKAVGRVFRGIGRAVRARPGLFLGVAAGVFLLDIFLPPLVLSVARKPVDYFTFNPWLKRFPEWVASSQVTLDRKLEFIPNLALFWFTAEGGFEPEWGFAVTVSDLLRFVLMALLIGIYFALWFYRRDRQVSVSPGARRARQGGVAGALVSTLGLSTSPCTVTGCGAPVIPVVGLAFTGLSSSTIKWMSELSTLAVWVVLGALVLGVLWVGWVVGDPTPFPRVPPPRR
ncbi:MAG TPA: hypothetical protein VFN71_15510 [Methylomirabilota bacterium]|nr:hypothetical protein [Methylomirabilota bacterium]